MSLSPEPPPKKRPPLRMLSLAEIVGVAALVIAGLGYWDSHRERVQQDQERAKAEAAQRRADAERGKVQAQAAQQEAAKHALLLIGAPANGELRLQPTRPEQVIQTQVLWFPSNVRVDSVSTTGNPRIEAGWIEDKLRRAATAADHQVPVAIETTFIEDGQTRTDRSLYMIGFSLRGRLVGGPKVVFEGLSLASHGVSGGLQAAANDLWINR